MGWSWLFSFPVTTTITNECGLGFFLTHSAVARANEALVVARDAPTTPTVPKQLGSYVVFPFLKEWGILEHRVPS